MKIPDLIEIAVAWKRKAAPSPEEARIADSRLAICNTCVHKAFSELTQQYICAACGCLLHTKVFSPKGISACPKDNWTE